MQLVPRFLICLLLLAAASCSTPQSAARRAPALAADRGQVDLQRLEVSLASAPPNALEIYYQRESWQPLAIEMARIMRQTHASLAAFFSDVPPMTTTLILLDRDLFRSEINSPAWIQAVYYKEQILVPMSAEERPNYYRLFRSLKHEYTHALVHALAGGECPGWIDEGLAQWVEGEADPVAKHLLADWLRSHLPIPLNELHGGFLTLDEQRAKVGYAQSRYAVEDLINTYGIRALAKYFTSLRDGSAHEQAFFEHFGLRQLNYEKRLAVKMNRWAVRFRED